MTLRSSLLEKGRNFTMKMCKHVGCMERQFAQGLCIEHHRPFRKTCKHVGCNLGIFKDGLCIRHYRAPVAHKTYCSAVGCKNEIAIDNLCNKHLEQKLKGDSILFKDINKCKVYI